MTNGDANAAALGRLPHAPPFRFVSRLLSLEPGVRASGEWTVSGREDFFRGHFPGDPIVPGALIVESLSQLAGLVAFSGTDPDRPARLARIDVKLTAPVRPPVTILLDAGRASVMDSLHLFNVTARVEHQTVATGSVVLAETDRGVTNG